MEEGVCRDNAKAALKRVKKNKGSSGIDGMTVDELAEHLKTHWEKVREHEIAKKDGGVRKLGIPTVLDRFIQQLLLNVLQPRFDASFSESSHGFRPGRNAHDAACWPREGPEETSCAAQKHIQSGKRWVVDVDLEKFFDRVNHDVLTASEGRQSNIRISGSGASIDRQLLMGSSKSESRISEC